MNYPPLSPIDPFKLKPFKDFGVLDLEAYQWINHVVTGLYSPEIGFQHFSSMIDAVDFLFSDANSTERWWAHNGGGYDFLFVIESLFPPCEYHIDRILSAGGKLISIDVFMLEHKKITQKTSKKRIKEDFGDGTGMIKTKKINFSDSLALLQGSLHDLCVNFNVEHKKQEIDYETLREITPEVLEYLEYDCRGLHEVLTKFYNWPLIQKAGPAITTASQSIKVLRTFLKQPIMSLPDSVDDFVRPYYFGGRTEIFKPVFEGNENNKLSVFDVNSLYPTVMRDFDFPNSHRSFVNEYFPDEMGFYDAVVEVPEDMYIPPLGTIFKIGSSHKLIFPVGTFKGRWTTIELEYAKSIGVKIISTGQGVLFNSGGPYLREFVETLYEMRKQSKKDSIDNVMCKLIMNSAYGRFGLRRDREELSFWNGISEGNDARDIKHLNGTTTRLVKTATRLDKSFSNVAAATWVTAHSKIYMHKLYSQAPEKLYYTDTDCCMTTHNYKSDQTVLGGLKFEKDCSRAAFILPKTYILEDRDKKFKSYMEDGKQFLSDHQVTMKGFDKKKVGHFSVNDFKEYLEGDKTIRVINAAKFSKISTSSRNGKFLYMTPERPHQLRQKYDKRRIVKTIKGYDTEPLIIRDDKIINL